MFDRLISLIGIDNFKKIENARVLVIGIGGVGGYVIEALVRSGIKNLTIIDGDSIDESNLNRQIIALHSTLGKKKVDAMRERLMDINPELKLDCIDRFIKEEDISSLDLDKFDFIVDAIDDVPAKIALAKASIEKGKRFIMATGTAKKLHPEFLKMTTLDKTSYDPLAKRLRSALRGYSKDIVVVASSESPIEGDSKTLGSSVFVPASAGLLIASYIINDIIK